MIASQAFLLLQLSIDIKLVVDHFVSVTSIHIIGKHLHIEQWQHVQSNSEEELMAERAWLSNIRQCYEIQIQIQMTN